MTHPFSSLPARRCVGGFVILLLMLASLLRGAEPAKRTFSLAADAAERSLKAFSAQSGVEVLFATQTVGKVRTNPVQGEFTPREAMQRLTQGTGLLAAEDARTGAFTVSSDPNGPRAAQTAPSVRPQRNDSRAGDAGETETVKLSEFLVSTDRDRGYYSSNSAAGSVLADTPIKNLPTSISVINRELLDDLQPTDIREALKFSASWNPDTGQIRGLDALGSDAAGTGRSGYGTNGLTETGAVDRVEVLKGPPSILYGSANPGGTINAVPKRPQTRNFVELEAQYGNFQRRYRFEANRVLRPNLRTRVGLQFTQRDSNNDQPQNQTVITDFDEDERLLFFNSTLWRPFAGTEVIVDFEYLRGRETRGDKTSLRFVTVNGQRLPWYRAYAMPLTWSISGPDARRSNDHYYFTGAVNQKITRWLKSESTLWYQWRASNQFGSVGVEESTGAAGQPALKSVRVGNYNRSTNDQRSAIFTQRLLADFSIKDSTHRLLLRYNYYNFYNDSQTFRAYNAGTNPVTGLTAANEVKGPWLQIEGASGAQIAGYDRAFPAGLSYTWRYDQDNHDNPQRHQANAIHNATFPTRLGKFHTLAGVSYHNQVESYRTTYANVGGQLVNRRLLQRPHRSASRPSAGMVYEPREGFGIYGLWAQSFAVPNTQNSFQELLPNREGENYEVGVKLDLFDRRLSGTLSYFDTVDFNRPLNDPNAFNVNTRDVNGNGPRDPGFNPNALAPNTPRGDQAAIGEYRSRGVDFDLTLQPWRSFQTTFSTTLMKAGTEKDPDPSNLNMPLTGFAEKNFAVVARYEFQSGFARGFALGGAFRWTDDYFLSRVKQTPAVRGSPYVDYYRPGARALNLFAKYNLKLGNRNVWLQLNVDNVLRDERTLNEVNFTNRTTFAIGTPVVWRLTSGLRF